MQILWELTSQVSPEETVVDEDAAFVKAEAAISHAQVLKSAFFKHFLRTLEKKYATLLESCADTVGVIDQQNTNERLIVARTLKQVIEYARTNSGDFATTSTGSATRDSSAS